MNEQLVGTWELKSYRRFRDGVFYRDTMGSDATGRIIYSASGHMSAFLLSASWTLERGTPQAWDTFLAYSARWTWVGDNTIHHDVDMSSIQEFIGRRLVRFCEWTEEGFLKLTTDGHVTAAGQKSHDELVWRKVSDVGVVSQK